MNLVLRPAAAADLDEEFLWYEAQRPGLGNQFLAAIEQVFLAVCETPGSSIATPDARMSPGSRMGVLPRRR